ncbi:MAG: hypothetical protein JW763_03655 [candidate division Zixibacteria bacterium]|nr:hypothetical protein [candidate division Zixibacteria bacterium]
MKPNLGIVPRTRIVPIMAYRPEKVAYLETIIEQTNSIRNPLQVAPLDNDRYLLLDDGAILEAACRLKLRYLPVQIFSLPTVGPVKAGAFVSDWDESLLKAFTEFYPRAMNIREVSDSAVSDEHEYGILLRANEYPPRLITFASSAAKHVPIALCDFLSFVSRRCSLAGCRFSDVAGGGTIRLSPGDCRFEVLHLQADDLAFAIRHDFRFPAGLLWFENIDRVLGINYPVRVLNENVPVRDKEQFLHELINLRLASGHSEYIAGGVYLLNY